MAKIATREAYGQALAALARQDDRIVALDADLSKSTKSSIFAEAFPERFFNMGIAEANMVAAAAGLAIGGLKAFCSSFAVFATGRAYEVIRNSVCYPRLNVKIAGSHAGISVGEDGGSHQAVEDIAIMRALPNMQVLVPADGVETAKMVNYLAAYDGPAYLRLGRSPQPVLFNDDYTFTVGKAPILRKGRDVALLACGMMVGEAITAANALAVMGVEAAVVNMSSLKPIDEETIVAHARSCGALVTAEEHTVIGGLGSAVCEVLAQTTPCPVEFVGIDDTFGESGQPTALFEKYGLTAAAMVAAAQRAVARK